MVHLLLRRNVHSFEGVGQDETVHTDHDRKRKLFGDLESLDMEVNGFLVVFGKELNPAAVTLTHGVGVIIPNVNRAHRWRGGNRHDDRKTETGGVVNRFSHIKQTLGSGSSVGTAAGDGTADSHAHGCEFTFNV